MTTTYFASSGSETPGYGYSFPTQCGPILLHDQVGYSLDGWLDTINALQVLNS